MTKMMNLQRSRGSRVLMAAAIVCSVVVLVPTTVDVVGAEARGSAGNSTDETRAPSTSTVKVRPSANTKRARRQVDVLTASREDIERKVEALDQEYTAQQDVVREAAKAVRVAEGEVAEADLRVRVAQKEVHIAQRIVREYALETYARPPVADSMRILSIADTQDAGFVNDVLKIMTDERHKVVQNLTVKKKIAAMEEDRAHKAAAEAQRRSAEATAQLASLDGLRQEQTQLISQMDERLENALAEAAALEAVDEQVARELAAQELALRESANVAKLAARTTGPAPKATNVVSRTTTSSTSTGTLPKAGSTTTRPPSPSTTRPPSPATTRPPSPTTTRPPSPTTTRPPTTAPPGLPAGVVTWAEIVYVGGIPVHRSIASKVSGLLNAATAAGFSLSGGGYRDSAAQIRTRMANCGTSYYDIYEKPSGQCTPPTAIPGRSMHERGLAMDLKSGGALITSRSNPAFIWLKANAAKYGFYNLPSEPWHWSTNGN